MKAVQEVKERVGIKRSCDVFGVSRMTEYRMRCMRKDVDQRREEPARVHPRALTASEQQIVLSLLYSNEFVDCAPATVYASLLEKGSYYCSTSTMYRLLRKNRATAERRQIRHHATYEAPQLLAQAPNQVWTWDITKLMGYQKFEYFYLYVMLDLFSRRVMGWMVAEREGGTLASEFIRDCCAREKVQPGTLTVHSDRGAPMMSKPVVALMSALDVHKTVSRPHVSNDNPFIESHFKTMKYRPCFPKKFGSIQDARATLTPFFSWYNGTHRHSGIAYFTPNDVHYGRVERLQERRQQVLTAAYDAAPQRFVKGMPSPTRLPLAAWINPPQPAAESAALRVATTIPEALKGATQHVNIA